MLGPTTALAQAPAGPTGFTVVDDTEPSPPLVAPAKDTLGGHFIVGGSAVASAPFGELQNGYSAQDLGAGLGGMLDLGIGLSRVVSIGVWGEGLAYSNSSACRYWPNPPSLSRDPCSGLSFTVGPFVRYHLLQGMRLDPWILVGPGYRVLTQETPAGTKTYAGVEYLHAAVGGDYYLTTGFGIGPWVGLDGGVLAKRPNPLLGPAVKTAWHTEFVAGLRVVLDIPGK
jgi:hypothetical protein